VVWLLGGLALATKRQLEKARDPEREQERRLLDAYARGIRSTAEGRSKRSGASAGGGVSSPGPVTREGRGS